MQSKSAYFSVRINLSIMRCAVCRLLINVQDSFDELGCFEKRRTKSLPKQRCGAAAAFLLSLIQVTLGNINAQKVHAVLPTVSMHSPF